MHEYNLITKEQQTALYYTLWDNQVKNIFPLVTLISVFSFCFTAVNKYLVTTWIQNINPINFNKHGEVIITFC